MKQVTTDAAAAFRYAADELMENTKANEAKNYEQANEALGGVMPIEHIQDVVEEALLLDTSSVAKALAFMAERINNLPDMLTATHVYSSMSMVARFESDPATLLAMVLSKGGFDERD